MPRYVQSPMGALRSNGFALSVVLLFAVAVAVGVLAGQSLAPSQEGGALAATPPATAAATPSQWSPPIGRELAHPPARERHIVEEPARSLDGGDRVRPGPGAPVLTPEPPRPTPSPTTSPTEAATRAALRALHEDAARAGVQDPIAVATDLLNASEGDVEVFAEQIPARLVPGADLPPRPANAWALAADLDGDGTPEWLVSIPAYLWRSGPGDRACYVEQLPHGHQRCPGLVVLFGRGEKGFAPLLELGIFPGPQVIGLEDLLRDGTPEVLLTSTDCGAHTCYTELSVGQWDGRTWREVGRMSQASTEISLADPGDGRPRQIVFHGDTYGSAGAGPQRRHTQVYAYDAQAGRYRLVQDILDPDPDSYFRMLDANGALAAGDLDKALTLASDVLARPHTDPGFAHPGRRDDRIAAYAAVEAMLVYALRGDPERVAALAEDVVAQYDGADNAYVEAAQRLRETYERTRDPVAACGEMARVVRERLSDAQFYGSYGYNQERLRVDQLCAQGGGVPEGQPTGRECAPDERCL